LYQWYFGRSMCYDVFFFPFLLCLFFFNSSFSNENWLLHAHKIMNNWSSAHRLAYNYICISFIMTNSSFRESWSTQLVNVCTWLDILSWLLIHLTVKHMSSRQVIICKLEKKMKIIYNSHLPLYCNQWFVCLMLRFSPLGEA
jgi:hypothetical protein